MPPRRMLISVGAVENEALELIAQMSRQFDNANVHLRSPSYTRVIPAIVTPVKQRLLLGEKLRNTLQERHSDNDDEYGAYPFEGEDLDALERDAQQHATAGRLAQRLNNRPRDSYSIQRDL